MNFLYSHAIFGLSSCLMLLVVLVSLITGKSLSKLYPALSFTTTRGAVMRGVKQSLHYFVRTCFKLKYGLGNESLMALPKYAFWTMTQFYTLVWALTHLESCLGPIGYVVSPFILLPLLMEHLLFWKCFFYTQNFGVSLQITGIYVSSFLKSIAFGITSTTAAWWKLTLIKLYCHTLLVCRKRRLHLLLLCCIWLEPQAGPLVLGIKYHARRLPKVSDVFDLDKYFAAPKPAKKWNKGQEKKQTENLLTRSKFSILAFDGNRTDPKGDYVTGEMIFGTKFCPETTIEMYNKKYKTDYPILYPGQKAPVEEFKKRFLFKYKIPWLEIFVSWTDDGEDAIIDYYKHNCVTNLGEAIEPRVVSFSEGSATLTKWTSANFEHDFKEAHVSLVYNPVFKSIGITRSRFFNHEYDDSVLHAALGPATVSNVEPERLPKDKGPAVDVSKTVTCHDAQIQQIEALFGVVAQATETPCSGQASSSSSSSIVGPPRDDSLCGVFLEERMAATSEFFCQAHGELCELFLRQMQGYLVWTGSCSVSPHEAHWPVVRFSVVLGKPEPVEIYDIAAMPQDFVTGEMARLWDVVGLFPNTSFSEADNYLDDIEYCISGESVTRSKQARSNRDFELGEMHSPCLVTPLDIFSLHNTVPIRFNFCVFGSPQSNLLLSLERLEGSIGLTPIQVQQWLDEPHKLLRSYTGGSDSCPIKLQWKAMLTLMKTGIVYLPEEREEEDKSFSDDMAICIDYVSNGLTNLYNSFSDAYLDGAPLPSFGLDYKSKRSWIKPKVIDHGFFEGPVKGSLVSRSSTTEEFASAKFIGVPGKCLVWKDTSFTLINYYYTAMGLQKPTDNYLGVEMKFCPADFVKNADDYDLLVFYECGPTYPKTAYDIWTQFSDNSEQRPVYVDWCADDRATNNMDVQAFPLYMEECVENSESVIYSWEEVELEAVFCRDQPLRQRRLVYKPVRQVITHKIRKSPDFVALPTHEHQDGDKTGTFVCDPRLCRRSGGRVGPNTGLSAMDYRNLVGTLLNMPLEYRYRNIVPLVLKAPSRRFGFNEIRPYALATLKTIDWLGSDLIEAGTFLSKNADLATRNKSAKPPVAQPLYTSPFESKSRHHHSKDGRRGGPQALEGRRMRQCRACGLWSSPGYKWIRGYCESCHLIMNDPSKHPITKSLSSNLYHPLMDPDRNGYSVKNLPAPFKMAPAPMNKKPKPLREEAVLGGCDGSTIGYSVKPVFSLKEDVTAPSMACGILVGNLARVLNTDVNTIKEILGVRLFAKPLSSPLPGQYDKLYRFLRRFNVLGRENIYDHAVPFCCPNFTVDGPLARDLIELKLVKRESGRLSHEHLISLLQDIEGKFHLLNDRVWRLPPEVMSASQLTGSAARRLSNAKTWLGAFEPRKRKRYLQALVNWSGRADQAVEFSFFIKREQETHACKLDGIQPKINGRVICDADSFTQVIAGPVLKRMTFLMHEILHDRYFGTYFGGLTPGAGNAWIRKRISPHYAFLDPAGNERIDYVVIENDFSKMDCTYSRDCFRFVKDCYRYWGLPVDEPYFKNVLDGWEQPKGIFKYKGIKVWAPVMNASGRSDTALMNAFINFYVQFSSYIAVKLNKDLDDITQEEFDAFVADFRCGVLGDDSITFTPYFDNMDTMVADEVAKYGFETRDMKIHHTPKHLVFLGSRPYPVKVVTEQGIFQTLAWGPTIGRRIFKMGFATDVQIDPLQWLHQTSYSVVNSFDFVPIVRDIARKQLEFVTLEGPHALTQEQLENRHDEEIRYKRALVSTEKFIDDWPRMTAFLKDVYDFTQRDYQDFLSALGRVKSMPCYLNSPTLDRLVTKDTS